MNCLQKRICKCYSQRKKKHIPINSGCHSLQGQQFSACGEHSEKSGLTAQSERYLAAHLRHFVARVHTSWEVMGFLCSTRTPIAAAIAASLTYSPITTARPQNHTNNVLSQWTRSSTTSAIKYSRTIGRAINYLFNMFFPLSPPPPPPNIAPPAGGQIIPLLTCFPPPPPPPPPTHSTPLSSPPPQKHTNKRTNKQKNPVN